MVLVGAIIIADLYQHLEMEFATYSSILAWKIPWTEKPARLQCIGLQIAGHI